MFQIAVPLCSLPVQLVCLGNSQVAFVRTQHFSAIYETFKDYAVCIDEEGIKFTGSILDSELLIPYNEGIEWRDKPVIKEWLQSMNLTSPI